MLVFVYEEQFAWVKWGRSRSQQFRIVNGTRQGSVLSPSLFSLYMDELLVKLRRLGIGCHISGIFFGAAMYADDLILMAPSRNAMQTMLQLCEQYAEEHNLMFSTDPCPELSKTKCLYMVGKVRAGLVQYPKPVSLYGVPLPWVTSANHIGHTLSQDCTMEEETRSKRMSFITDSTDIREMFAWAHPLQVLEAIRIYCCSFYGSMLWDLYGEEAKKVYRCWNTAAKLVWEVPRNTFTFVVEQLLTTTMQSVRDSLIMRYSLFMRSLNKSESKEIRILASCVQGDARSTTGRNIANISTEIGEDLIEWGKQKMRVGLTKSSVPLEEEWRVPLLSRLLQDRIISKQAHLDNEPLDYLINMVCSSTFD